MNRKYKKIIKFSIFTIVCLSIAIGYPYIIDFYNNLGKGEYEDLVVNKNHTLYFIYKQNSVVEDLDLLPYKKILATIGLEYKDKIKIIPINSNEPFIQLNKERLRIDSYPVVVIINKNGFISGYYKNTVNYEQLKYIVDRLY